MSELAMGQQQKRKSHHDNRALIITVIIHFEFTIRQYIMYLYISTHKIGIVDEDVQLENWQRSTKHQCSIQQHEAHRRARKRMGAQMRQRTEMSTSTRSHALAHDPLSVRLPTIPPPALSHSSLCTT